jgi:predicted DNA binding CopG/RHH family protein
VKKEKKVVGIYTTENYKVMSKELPNFSTSELEIELLSRKSCQFNKPNCQKQATNYLVKKLDN